MQIAQYLNKKGVPSPKGGSWKDRTVRYILKNETYTGKTFRGKNPTSRLPGSHEFPEPISKENAHEAAASREKFEKVQQLIAGRRREQTSPQSHSSLNPLSELVKCGPCNASDRDSNMVVATNKGIKTLRCSHKKNSGRDSCAQLPVRLDELRKAVIARLMEHILTEKTLRNVTSDVAENSAQFLRQGTERKATISKRLSHPGRNQEYHGGRQNPGQRAPGNCIPARRPREGKAGPGTRDQPHQLIHRGGTDLHQRPGGDHQHGTGPQDLHGPRGRASAPRVDKALHRRSGDQRPPRDLTLLCSSIGRTWRDHRHGNHHARQETWLPPG